MLKNKYLITVITATYNAANYLPRLVASLSAQTFNNFEWVVADGGSTDGTLEILNQVNDLNIVVDSRSDNGIYDAFNRGVSLASGEFVIFIGSDDEVLVDFFDISKILFDHNVVYYGDVCMKSTNILYDGGFSKWKIVCRNICQQAIFYPRRIFSTYSFDCRYKILSDWVLNIKLYGDKNIDFVYINKVVSRFDDVSGVSQNYVDELFVKNRFRLVSENLGLKYAFFVALRVFVKRVASFLTPLPRGAHV